MFGYGTGYSRLPPRKPLGSFLPQLTGGGARPAREGSFGLSADPSTIPVRRDYNEQQTEERVFRVMGLDLGQLKDPSAAVMVRVRKYEPTFTGPRYPFVEVCYLRQWAPNTDYHEIVDDVLMVNPDLLVPDFGGPGPPVVDILHKRAQELHYRGKILPVQSVSSNAMSRVHNDTRRKRQHLTVPKRDIVSMLNILQQRRVIDGLCAKCGGTGEMDVKDGRKKLSKGCPHCRTIRYPSSPDVVKLFAEFKTFKMRYTRSANQTFDHRGPDHHGDMSIALALALWALQRGTRELAVNSLQ